MMNKKLFLTTVLIGSYGLSANANQKPNILLILADDLGYKDCGFTGSKIFETPNLDALSKKGIVFNNAYAGAGNCAPSRASLLSGKYSPRTGVYAVGSTTRGPVEEMKLVPVKNTNELNSSFVTFAEALKREGYTTGLFGKWHLGTSETTKPEAQGFDVYFDSRRINPNKRRNEPADPKGIFSLTDAAMKFMEANKDKPTMTYLAHHAIHGSIESRPASLQKFLDKGVDKQLALYAACIYDLDESIGNLMQFLKTSGLDKNTLIVITSDNGATPKSSQEPLRGNKGCYYDGGIREPFIALWPGKIKPGTIQNTPIINLDLYPTFLAVAGNTKVKLDGENLLPLFLGQAQTTNRDEIFWHFPGYLNTPVTRGRDDIFRTRPVTTMRKGDWKIQLYHEEWLLNGGRENLANNHAVEIYNLKEDEGERVNLANVNTQKRDELLTDLLKWMKETNAPWPSLITENHKPILNEGDDGGGEE